MGTTFIFPFLALTIGLVTGQQQYYQQPPGQGQYASPQQVKNGQSSRAPPPPPGFFFPPAAPEPEQLQDEDEDIDTQRYLTPPSLKFKIGIIADKLKDTNKNEDTGNFKSYLREGSLYIRNNKTNPESPNITVEFDEQKGVHTFESGINYGGKGFQLSTLNVFNGKLYACDHKTGIVYELKKVKDENPEVPPRKHQSGADYDDGVDSVKHSSVGDDTAQAQSGEEKFKYVPHPWLILSNEKSNKAFKCEWGLVKDKKLWIGSNGELKMNTEDNKSKDDTSKEFNDQQNDKDNQDDEGSSEFNKDRQFVKRIDKNGQVETINFSEHYDELAEAYDLDLKKGHIVHEAAEWSEILQKWLFIPRRVTKENKNKETWDSISTNIGVIVNDPFDNFQVQEFGNLTKTLGFVGLRFIPGTQDKFILALKYGKDNDGNQLSKLVVFDLNGKEIMPERTVAEGAYSAVEFL